MDKQGERRQVGSGRVRVLRMTSTNKISWLYDYTIQIYASQWGFKGSSSMFFSLGKMRDSIGCCNNQFNHNLMQTVFDSVKKLNESFKPSLPSPEFLTPPKGMLRSRTNQQLTQTVPAWIKGIEHRSVDETAHQPTEQRGVTWVRLKMDIC